MGKCFKCEKEFPENELSTFSMIDDWLCFEMKLCNDCLENVEYESFEAQISFNCPTCKTPICTLCGACHEVEDCPSWTFGINKNMDSMEQLELKIALKLASNAISNKELEKARKLTRGIHTKLKNLIGEE